MQGEKLEPKAILVAEDESNDAVLMRRVLKQGMFTNPLHFVANGEDAIAYFAGIGTIRRGPFT